MADIVIQHLRGAYEQGRATIYPVSKAGYEWVRTRLDPPKTAGTLRRISQDGVADVVTLMQQDGLDVDVRT